MSQPTLFPLDDPLTAAPDRIEPVLWLRRLVIVRELDADTIPIRDTEFRRGLNIIQTHRRPAAERHVVGHSVGKTLLTRLIRYSLGETHFAIKPVRDRIAARLPSAFVIAHWRVSGGDWCVVRPLQEARETKSFAVRSDDWRVVLREDAERLPFNQFTAAVETATISQLPALTLPNTQTRRHAYWLDLLGWLTRDYQCGYRAYNDWRHKDADSGFVLDRDDASLVLRWIMGLIDPSELPLRQQHQSLLDQRRTSNAERERLQRFVDVTYPSLRAKLELVEDEGQGLFAQQVTSLADTHIADLDALLDDRRSTSRIAEFEADVDATQDQLADAEGNRRSLDAIIQRLCAQVKQREAAPLRNPYASGSLFENCSEPRCPMRLLNRPAPAPDPARAEMLAELQADISDQEAQLIPAGQQCDQLRAAVRDARQQLRDERTRLSREESGIEQSIGRWKSYRQDAKQYADARDQLDRTEARLAEFDTAIEESRTQQEAARELHSQLRHRFSQRYDRLLKDAFDETASGQIEVNAIGLRPSPSDRLGSNGAALSTMATVLAFDLACLTASIEGLGQHPRFHIHDSPREGDMEEPMFHRLFEIVHRLETLFPDREPSFQYIVTTTTPPPEELADETNPFVRLTLDAREDAKRLLGIQF